MSIENLDILAKTPNGYVLQKTKYAYDLEEFFVFPTEVVIDNQTIKGKTARLTVGGNGVLYLQNQAILLPTNFDFEFKINEKDYDIKIKLLKGTSVVYTLFSDDWLQTKYFYKDLVEVLSIEPSTDQVFNFSTVNNGGIVTYGPGSDSEFPEGQNVLIPVKLRPANYSRNCENFYINPLSAQATSNSGFWAYLPKQWGMSAAACNMPIALAPDRNYFSVAKFKDYKNPPQPLNNIHDYTKYRTRPSKSGLRIIPRGDIWIRLRPDLIYSDINTGSNTPFLTSLSIRIN